MAKKREDAELKRALKASKVKHPLEHWATELLFWWGFDIGGWASKCPMSASTNREKVLAALGEFEDVDLPSLEGIREQYQRLTGSEFTSGEEEFDPEREGDPDSSSEEEEEEEEEEEAEPPKKEQPAAKKQRIEPPIAPLGAGRMCQHCCKPNTEHFCPSCHLRSDLSYDHPQNADILAQIRLTSASTAAANSKLGKRDTELERLANQGIDFPRFGNHTSISSFEAFKAGKAAYQATSFAPASDSLLKLIRSGKLTEVGFALPISVGDAAAEAADKDSTGTLKAQSDGSVRMNLTTTAPPITSLNMFMRALVSTILPALADQPHAMFDWITLTRTLIALDDHGASWPKAKAYMERVLIHRVHTREEFGSLDQSILLSIQAELHTVRAAKKQEPPASGGGSSAQTKSTTPRKRTGSGADRAPTADTGRACMQYNHGNCTYGNDCKYLHICDRRGCGGKHPGIGCSIGTASTFAPSSTRHAGGSGAGGKRTIKTEQ